MDDISFKKINNFIKANKFDKALNLCKKIIKSTSNDDVAHMLLGLTYFRTNKLDMAKKSLEFSNQLNGNSVATLNNLGLVYSALNDYKLAISAFKKGLKIEPMNKALLLNTAQTHYQFGSFHQAAFQYKSNRLLGVVENNTDHLIVDCLNKGYEHVEAIAEIDEIEDKLKLQSGNEHKSTTELLTTNLLLLKGELLIQLGQDAQVRNIISSIDVASLTLEHKIRLALIYNVLGEKEHKQALLGDIRINKHTPSNLLANYVLLCKLTEPEIVQVESYLKDVVLSNINYYYLAINLANQCKKQNNNERYKYWLTSANNKVKNSQTNLDHISILDRTMDKMKSVAIPYSNSDSNQPIFIVGMPRSGTTLLETMLAIHSDIHAGGELQVFKNALNKLSSPLEDATILEQGNRYLTVLDQLSSEDLDIVANEYLSKSKSYAKPGAKFIIDKLPHNFTVLGLINKVFPKAKIIYIKRNPISTCFSIYEQSFTPFHDYRYDLDYLADYYLKFREMMSFWSDYLPKNTMYEINYDDLVVNPEGELSDLFNYLALTKPSNVLEFYNTEGIVRTASLEQVRQPLYAKKQESWEDCQDIIQPLIKKLKKLI